MRAFLKSYVTILLGALITASPAFGQTSLGLTAGSGKDAKMGAISLSWPWDKKWFAQGDWYLGGYWQAELSYWRGDGDEPENNIAGLGFAPVFRLQPHNRTVFTPYIEGAIGLHLFNETKLHGGKQMGTAFEFGDHVGFGVTFGAGGKYDLGYRFQHFSNAGISKNNGGVDFHQLVFKIGL